jgi:hypothetical protein
VPPMRALLVSALWSSMALGAWPNGPESDLIAARSGTARYTNVVALLPGPDGGVVAVWEDDGSATRDIYAEWVSAEGVAQWNAGRGRKLVGTSAADAVQSVVAATEGGLYVAYTVDAGIRVSRFDQQGLVDSRFTTYASANSIARMVAANDGGLVLLTASSTGAQLTRISVTGVAVSSQMLVTQAPRLRSVLMVSDRRDGVLVRYHLDDGLPQLSRYSASLQVVYAGTRFGQGSVDVSDSNVTADFSGNAWVTYLSDGGLYAQRIGTSGSVTAPGALIRRVPGIDEHTVGIDPRGGLFVSYSEPTGNSNRLDVVHLNAQGQPDWVPAARALGTAVATNVTTWSRRDSWFLVWSTTSTVLAQRVYPDGGLALTAPFAISNHPATAPVARRVILNGSGPPEGPFVVASMSTNAMGIDGAEVRLKCVPYSLQWPASGMPTCFDSASGSAGGTGEGGVMGGEGGMSGEGGSPGGQGGSAGVVGAGGRGGAGRGGSGGLSEGDLVPLPRGCGCTSALGFAPLALGVFLCRRRR